MLPELLSWLRLLKQSLIEMPITSPYRGIALGQGKNNWGMVGPGYGPNVHCAQQS